MISQAPLCFVLGPLVSGCCLYELYTGKILFSGSDNNGMLKVIQEVKGRFPKRMLQKAFFAHKHFDADGTSFMHLKTDAATGQSRVTQIRYADKPVKDLHHMLREHTGAKASHADAAKIKQLADFIHQCTALDPQQRAQCDSLLEHPFVKVE